MSDKSKITSLIHMNLVIPELSVHLSAKGSYSIVNTVAIPHSPTLADFVRRRWVRIDQVVHSIHEKSRMPHWPFYSPPPQIPISVGNTISAAPMAVPSSDVLLGQIRDLLQVLADRQTSPEVLATHIAVQSARLGGTPSPGAVHVSGRLDDAPEFIPSSIVPTQKLDSSIKSIPKEVEKTGMDEAADQLRRLKKGDS